MTEAVKTSVEQAVPGAEVIVTCFNENGDLGAIANRTKPVARLQEVSGWAPAVLLRAC